MTVVNCVRWWEKQSNTMQKVLRGTTVNGTHDIHKNLHKTPFLLSTFGPITMVPRNSLSVFGRKTKFDSLFRVSVVGWDTGHETSGTRGWERGAVFRAVGN